MAETADVVIIGAGVIGASVAWHLVAGGCTNIVMLERAPRQGLGSTGKATGGVRAQFTTPVNIAMSLHSLEFFEQFQDLTGVDPEYHKRGYLFLAGNERQLDQLRAFNRIQRECGLLDVEFFDVQTISKEIPQLYLGDIAGGVFRQGDGFIKPLSVMRGFTEAALRSGARLSLDTDVTGIVVTNGRIAGVSTSKGFIETRTVINAAGAWARPVSQMAKCDIPVDPVRRQAMGVTSRTPFPSSLPMVIDLTNGFHFRPFPAGSTIELLLVWADHQEPVGYNTDFGGRFESVVRQHAAHRVPCLTEAEMNRETCRAGLYEMTPDHHAIIDASMEVKGLYYVNGFSGHGVMHSPAAGKMVADLVLKDGCDLFDRNALSLERFERGDVQHEASLI